MTISADSDICVLDERQFHNIAYDVLGMTYQIHNEFGRLLEEEVYKNLIRQRCEDAGIVPARREVELTVRFEDFRKSYFVDLLLANGVLIEAKAAAALTSAHEVQTLHYLLLCGLQHGLLVNLRSSKVGKRYVSTSLTQEEQRRFTVDDSAFCPADDAEKQLQSTALELLSDWGCFLQLSLYREAIVHFLGGAGTAVRRIPIYDGDTETGRHEVVMISDHSGLVLTALKKGKQAMRDHVKRFLAHTRLSRMQWINLNRHTVEFCTIE